MWYILRFLVLAVVVAATVSIGVLSCDITIDKSWATDWWLMLPGIGTLVLFFWCASENNYHRGIFAPGPRRKSNNDRRYK